MKVTVLTYLEKEGSSSHDLVVDQVVAALKQTNHKVSILGIHGNVKKLIASLTRRQPDLVFNLMEMFGGDMFGDISVAGLLNLMGIPYTGDGPGEIYLQQDKALTKKLLAYEGIACPDFAVFSQDADLETGGRLRMPLIVKPLRTDASIGINGNALVHTAKEMMERIAVIHRQVHDSALVEEYIEGREFYVGVLGNAEPVAFPPIEMDFSKLPKDMPHILDRKAKWDVKSPAYKGTQAVVADLSEELRAKLQRISLDAYRALRVRDYGRIDLRLTPTNELYLIEVNANPYLEQSSELATAAAAAGLDYPTLIQKIVEAAGQRFPRFKRNSLPRRSTHTENH